MPKSAPASKPQSAVPILREWKRARTKNKKTGCTRVFNKSGELIAGAEKYFEWVARNPFRQMKIETTAGKSKKWASIHPRVPTLDGFCLFLGISRRLWNAWQDPQEQNAYRPDLLPVMAEITSMIRDEKFAGAAAGVFRGNIVARDLGLADRMEVSGRDGGPIVSQSDVQAALTVEEKSSAYQLLLKKIDEAGGNGNR